MEEKEYNLKEEYNSLKEKYALPEILRIYEDFDIEKLEEKETDFLLRQIRKQINEKLAAYLHLFELLSNPSSPPLFVFSFLRGIGEKEKGEIREIYKELSKMQIEVMKLDTIYSEEKEAEFIKKSVDSWQKIKGKIFSLLEIFENNFEKEDVAKRSDYFG